MTRTVSFATKLLRPATLALALFGLLAACEEGAVVPAATPAAPTTNTSAPDQLHSVQSTTGGPVDGSRLAQALSICLDNIPDVGAARQQMLIAGFKFETTIEGQDLYSAANRSVFALLSVGDNFPRCAVGRDGLRDQAAIAFAESALLQAYGPAFAPADPAGFARPMIAAWIASPPGGILAVGVTPVIDLAPLLLGSFIVVTTNVEETGEK